MSGVAPRDPFATLRLLDERLDRARVAYEAAAAKRRNEIVRLHRQRYRASEIAEALGTSQEVVRRAVREAGG